MCTAADAKVLDANQTTAAASVTGDEVTPPVTKMPAERAKSSGEVGVKEHREATKVLLKYQMHCVDTYHYQETNTRDVLPKQSKYDNKILVSISKNQFPFQSRMNELLYA